MMFVWGDGTLIGRPAPWHIISMSPTGLSLGRLLASKNGLRFTRHGQVSMIQGVLSGSISSSFLAMGSGGLIQTASGNWGAAGGWRTKRSGCAQ